MPEKVSASARGVEMMEVAIMQAAASKCGISMDGASAQVQRKPPAFDHSLTTIDGENKAL
jgi:hypothetical protein